MTPGKRNYLLLSLFDFLYLFAWSSTMAFFVIWTTQHLGISATKTGLLYSVNAFIALLMQPFFGFISDKFGLKKRLIWLLVALLLPVGPFFIYVYAPLLVHNFWFGALLGGIYLGIIFNSGCGVIDSYIDKISRRYQFEIRSPLTGRDGNASTCKRESSLRQEVVSRQAVMGCRRRLVCGWCSDSP